MITITQAGMKWNQLLVEPGTHTTITHITVNGIGKIECGSAPGEFFNIPLWGEDINFIREEVDLEVLKKFTRVRHLFLGIEEIEQPLSRLGL